MGKEYKIARDDAKSQVETAQNDFRVTMVKLRQFKQDASGESDSVHAGEVPNPTLKMLREAVGELATEVEEQNRELSQLMKVDAERKRAIEDLEAEMNKHEQQAKLVLQHARGDAQVSGIQPEDFRAGF